MEKKQTAKEKERSVVQGKDPSERRVEFVFQSPEAKEVFLAGGFNGWDTQALTMVEIQEGTWSTTMQLCPRRYEFKMFVDGKWKEDMPYQVAVADAASKHILDVVQIPNPFGTHNLILWIQ